MGNDGMTNNVFGGSSQSLNSLNSNNNIQADVFNNAPVSNVGLNQNTVSMSTFNTAANPVNVFNQGSTNTAGTTASIGASSITGFTGNSGSANLFGITSSSGSSTSLSGVSGSTSGTNARIQLLPTPNTLSPGTPNILDNPNISASDKQTILLSNIKNT